MSQGEITEDDNGKASQSSDISIRTAVTRRSNEASFGKSPTTLVLRLMQLLRVSHMFDVLSRFLRLLARLKTVKPSGRLSSIHVASFGAVLLYLSIA